LASDSTIEANGEGDAAREGVAETGVASLRSADYIRCVAPQLNHTIVWCRDQKRSAGFLTEVLGLPAPRRFLHFLVVELANGVSMDFYETSDEVARQHYAFLVGDDEFDAIFGRIRERGLEIWADPARTRPGEINHHFGGRGVYFADPDGHGLEIITRPYGSESELRAES
jgi:catechol 2,3-dioxygenase-like lactoylglutathione lyase family enzyme